MSLAVLRHDGEEVEFIENDDFHVSVEFDWDSEETCAICGWPQGDDHEDEDHLWTEPPWEPNSLHIDKGEHGEVTVGISVGDPRGYFAMTIRKLDDGRLIMHVPYEGMGWAHMPLREHTPGTFVLG